jgi:PRTRC genetic system protein B
MIKRKDNFIPKAAMIIYESSTEQREEFMNGGAKTDDKLYVESHQIDEKGNILAGQALTEEAANQLGKKLYKYQQKLISGLIPDNLLYIDWQNDKPVLVWWTPSQQVDAFYTQGLKIPDGKINVPPLVWKWDHSRYSLQLWSHKEDRCPGLNDVLHHAPFHNVNERATVCLGGNGQKLLKKAATFIEIIKAAQTVFWRTRFSAVQNQSAITGNLNTLHHSLSADGALFPLDVLKPTKFKLAGICK